MATYLDFQNEVKAGKVRNVYFVMASDNYFVGKSSEILREKLFGSKNNKDNFFLRYGDEDSAEEILDLCNNFSSLFSSSKVIVVKRSEKLAKKLDELVEYSSKPDKDTTLMLCFDKDYVIDKKLNKELSFYDFTELPVKAYAEWIKSEFESRNSEIDNDALEMFLTLVPEGFDLVVTEIEKLCTYIIGNESNRISKQIVEKLVGYETEYSPEQLMSAIIGKKGNKSLEILDFLLNKGGINEIFLLSILTNYYFDLISFKTKGFSKGDNYSFYGKYKMWGDRLKFAKTFHNLLNEKQLKYSLLRILETDQKLKTSMLDSKTLMASLIEDLVNIS